MNSRRDQVVVPYVLWKMGLSFSEFSGMGNILVKANMQKTPEKQI